MKNVKPLAIPNAKDILVRNAPNGGNLFNGLPSLEECIAAFDSRFLDQPKIVQRIILKRLRKDLFPLRVIKSTSKAMFLIG